MGVPVSLIVIVIRIVQLLILLLASAHNNMIDLIWFFIKLSALTMAVIAALYAM